MTITPAALAALAMGDIENAKVAVTPGGIEAQEAAGQAAMNATTWMPSRMHPSREAFEAVGFKFGDAIDDIFLSATLPDGWTRKGTDHSMHSNIFDNQGRARVGVFYKASFYDRRAGARLKARFVVDEVEHANTTGFDKDTASIVVKDAGVEIKNFGTAGSLDWDFCALMRGEAEDWLDTAHPDWRDPVKDWTA
jgi:hypothetical protein